MINDKVERALRGLVAPMDLSEAEQELYFEKLSTSYWEPSKKMDAFFEDRRARGLGVGMNDAGDIVFAPTPAERAKRQEAYDAAVASARQEGLILPPDGHAIMRRYVYGLITWEERQEQMLALVEPPNPTEVWLSGVVKNMKRMNEDEAYRQEIVKKSMGLS